MNLENIMLNERSQIRRTTQCMNPFMWNIKGRQIHCYRKQSRSCQGWGRGEKRTDCLVGVEFPSRMVWKFRKYTVLTATQPWEYWIHFNMASMVNSVMYTSSQEKRNRVIQARLSCDQGQKDRREQRRKERDKVDWLKSLGSFFFPFNLFLC